MARRRRKDDGWAEIIAAIIIFSVWAYVLSSGFRKLVVVALAVTIVIGLVIVGRMVWRWRRVFSLGAKPQPTYEDVDWAAHESSYDGGEVSALSDAIDDRLQQIDWFQFEKLVGLIYKSRGYKVEHIGGAHPDGGVDLIVDYVDGQFIIQCKHWRKNNVTVKEVREFMGAMMDAGVSSGVFVTMHGYTKPAKEYAERNKIILCDAEYLKELIATSSEDYRVQMLDLLYADWKECPRCGDEMFEQKTSTNQSSRRPVWKCPKCRFQLRS